MRALIIYFALGLASGLADHGGGHLDRLGFWRDVLAWPFVAVGKFVDLRLLISDTAQTYATLAFAAALFVYAIAKLDLPFARPARRMRPDRPRPGP